MTDLQSIKDRLYSKNWEESLSAVDQLAAMHTEEAITILVEALDSTDNWIRNAASLGIREANNPSASKALLERIKELGTDEEIGTLVYSLETFDSSRNLLDIVNLYFNGNYEVKVSAKTILEDQQFQLTQNELEKVTQRLEQEGTTIQALGIRYMINES